MRAVDPPLSYQALAEELGIGAATVYDYLEKGKTPYETTLDAFENWLRTATGEADSQPIPSSLIDEVAVDQRERTRYLRSSNLVREVGRQVSTGALTTDEGLRLAESLLLSGVYNADEEEDVREFIRATQALQEETRARADDSRIS
jgi:transcriptional regulator with XRE-family HTH domain